MTTKRKRGDEPSSSDLHVLDSDAVDTGADFPSRANGGAQVAPSVLLACRAALVRGPAACRAALEKYQSSVDSQLEKILKDIGGYECKVV